MIRSCSQDPPPAQPRWTGSDPQPGLSLESIEESLAQAYLAANLRTRNIPLKEFMDDFEADPGLAPAPGGNQKNVAAVLSLGPTSLFEKLQARHQSARASFLRWPRSAEIA
jgi:hypothetical protein